MRTPQPPARDHGGSIDAEARWQELLAELDPEALTDAILPLVDAVEGYDASPIPRSEIRRTALLSFDAIIDGLRSGALDDAIAVAVEIGVSRARAGVPLSSLMTAVRLDFTVLWDTLTGVAGDDDARLIVRRTGTVLRIVDEYVAQTQRAYLAERRRMDEESESQRHELIEALFRSPFPTDEALADIAGELGISATTPLIVAAAVGRDDITALRVCVASLERWGVIAHTHRFDDALVVFSPSAPAGAGEMRCPGADASGRLLELRVGVTTASEGMRDLPGCARTSRELARLLDRGQSGAMTWELGWSRLVARNLAGAGSPLLLDVQRALAECSEAKRARLLEAVRSYLDTGNIGLTAGRLFCHRNTVSKHLREFHEITGVDPTIPAQAARLVIGWA